MDHAQAPRTTHSVEAVALDNPSEAFPFSNTPHFCFRVQVDLDRAIHTYQDRSLEMIAFWRRLRALHPYPIQEARPCVMNNLFDITPFSIPPVILLHIQQLVAVSDTTPHETLANNRVEGGAESEDEQDTPAIPRGEVAVEESGRTLVVTLHQVRALNTRCFSAQRSPAQRYLELSHQTSLSWNNGLSVETR